MDLQEDAVTRLNSGLKVTLTVIDIDRIADMLGVSAERLPYEAAGGRVYEIILCNESTGLPVRLVIWPLLSRVDAYISDCQVVFKKIDSVEYLPEVEIIFRRNNPKARMLVTTKGRISLAT